MDEVMIEAVARAIKGSITYSAFWPDSDYEIMAAAAIRACAQMVLDEALRAMKAKQHSPAPYTDCTAAARALKEKFT